MKTNALRPDKQTGRRLRSIAHFAKPAAHCRSWQDTGARPADDQTKQTPNPQNCEVSACA